jgi:SAM-dependent methyltransferase
MQTAERVSAQDLSDNYVFQRSVLAYVEAAKLVQGKVLEVGYGEGYGVKHLAGKAESYLGIDKYPSPAHEKEFPSNVKVQIMNVPPLTGIADNSLDFVVSFQVIEHIDNDELYVKEIARVLKPGGKYIVTTPNIKMSITRNPWHVREYTISELKTLLGKHFTSVQANGVFGRAKVMDYYNKNKASVQKITRFDIFNLQYRLPRWMLQIPYDFMNRRNRKKLLQQNNTLVSDITMEDYYVAEAKDECFDLFYIATK